MSSCSRCDAPSIGSFLVSHAARYRCISAMRHANAHMPALEAMPAIHLNDSDTTDLLAKAGLFFG